MSTDDTVNAYMRNVGEMEGVRHRAEKAEARIVELEAKCEMLSDDSVLMQEYEKKCARVAKLEAALNRIAIDDVGESPPPDIARDALDDAGRVR
jgi:hypothetical protein